jgi:DNA-damage-inducible protein D
MDPIIAQVQKNFESIKKEQNGFEFWSAWELSPLLGYKTWAKFQEVIKRAQDACKMSEQSVGDHFSPAPAKSTGGRPHEHNLHTLFACVDGAQNGAPRKAAIALAQTYFATQTRRQELFEARMKEDKRLEARQKLKETESKIETTVYARGIKLPQEFATFKNKHIEALYGGMGISELKKKRSIPPARALADFDTHVELKAKDFALAMTDHNIKEKNLSGKYKLEEEVVKNSKATRQTLLSRGIRPEDLKADEDLKKIEQRRKQEQKLLKKK